MKKSAFALFALFAAASPAHSMGFPDSGPPPPQKPGEGPRNPAPSFHFDPAKQEVAFELGEAKFYILNGQIYPDKEFSSAGIIVHAGDSYYLFFATFNCAEHLWVIPLRALLDWNSGEVLGWQQSAPNSSDAKPTPVADSPWGSLAEKFVCIKK